MITDITPQGSVSPVLLDPTPPEPMTNTLASELDARMLARAAAADRLLSLGLTEDDINLLLP